MLNVQIEHRVIFGMLKHNIQIWDNHENSGHVLTSSHVTESCTLVFGHSYGATAFINVSIGSTLKYLSKDYLLRTAQSKRLSDKVDHLKDVIKELVDTNLFSGDALSVLDKTKKTRTKETELVRYLGIKSVRLQEAL
ncbi:hypothetical protein NQ318_007124 [Aromia moschata]|uniref:Uncharacterized protein n=1 Tax=Aromia moschata TaxID=1265417 RepID=A0AAV8XBG0_9CUCU|nr:hypothetical protein NQ318_007124 [Aromia moschata]